MTRENLIETVVIIITMVKRKRKQIEGIAFKEFKHLKVGQVKELTKQFKEQNKFKVPNVQLVMDYGKKIPL